MPASQKWEPRAIEELSTGSAERRGPVIVRRRNMRKAPWKHRLFRELVFPLALQGEDILRLLVICGATTDISKRFIRSSHGRSKRESGTVRAAVKNLCFLGSSRGASREDAPSQFKASGYADLPRLLTRHGLLELVRILSCLVPWGNHRGTAGIDTWSMRTIEHSKSHCQARRAQPGSFDSRRSAS